MDKLSYITSTNDQTSEYTTITEELKRQATEQPNKEAIICYDENGRESITFHDLYNKSLKFASCLDRLGIRKGDFAFIVLPNSIEWLVIEFGLMIVGAVPVSTFALRHDAKDHQYTLSKTSAVAIFTTTKNREATSNITALVRSDDLPFFKYAIATDIEEDEGVFLSFSKLMNKEVTDFDRAKIYIDPDDTAMIMRTSGTTGRPKFIEHSHRSFIRSMMMYSQSAESTSDTIFFTNAPFGWILGTPCLCLVSGWSRVSIANTINLDLIPKYIKNERCNIALFTSDLLNKLLVKGFEEWPPSLKCLLFGGSPLKRKAAKVLHYVESIMVVYGSSEMGFVTTTKLHQFGDVEDNIAGYPFPGVEIKVTNSEHELVKRGTIGRIYVRGNYRFLGYYNDHTLTHQTVSPANWVDSTDHGFISESGKLYVMGRSGDEIVKGTDKFQSSEVEILIKELGIHQIDDVVAMAVPDDIYGQEVCVCIIRKTDSTITEQELRDIFDQRIDNEKRKPKYIIFVDSFPYTSNGKLMKHVLIDQAKSILFPQQ